MMKDPVIEDLVTQLKHSVAETNRLMEILQDNNVEVRITYVESSTAKKQKQGINIWRITQHNDYL
jgi:hypothetical protein